MSLLGFKAQNHEQQVSVRGATNDIDDRETDDRIWEPFHERFHFTVDAAADHHNAKLPRYWTRHDDGLAQPWAGERVWCNPPYSDIAPWVRKALDATQHQWVDVPEGSALTGSRPFRFCTACDVEEWMDGTVFRRGFPGVHAELVVMLLPANRTEQRWWQDLVEPHRDQTGGGLRVEFLRGRLRFLKPGEQQVGPNSRPPFGCCLLIFTPTTPESTTNPERHSA